MVYFLYVFLVALLLILIAEDFTQRSIHWFLPPLLFVVLADINFIGNTLQFSLKYAFINSGFVILQVALATVYFSIKEKRLVNIFASYFGLGDLLFMLGISIAFSVPNFIAFYVLSMLITILVSLYPILRKGDLQYKIPLAGIQAIVFLSVYSLDVFNASFNLHDDSLLLSYLTTLQ